MLKDLIIGAAIELKRVLLYTTLNRVKKSFVIYNVTFEFFLKKKKKFLHILQIKKKRVQKDRESRTIYDPFIRFLCFWADEKNYIV